MKAISRRRFLPLVTVVPLAGGLASCRSAGIKDAYTARDGAGRLKTKSFQNDKTEIHIIVEMVSGRDDVVLILNLAVPEGAPPQLEETELAPGKGTHKIDIKLFIEDANGNRDNDGPWTSGEYKADILLDGELEETLKFSVL